MKGQQATSNKQQATDNRQQATNNKQQVASNRQQATSRQIAKIMINVCCLSSFLYLALCTLHFLVSCALFHVPYWIETSK
jgi:hypothetical protein